MCTHEPRADGERAAPGAELRDPTQGHLCRADLVCAAHISQGMGDEKQERTEGRRWEMENCRGSKGE